MPLPGCNTAYLILAEHPGAKYSPVSSHAACSQWNTCPSSGMWRRVGLVGTDVSEEHVRSILRVERISELGTKLEVSLIVNAIVVTNPLILSTLKMEATPSSKTSVLTRHKRCHKPQNGILHSHRREDLTSYISVNKHHHPTQVPSTLRTT
jgi:hypothetical protein